MASSIKKEWDDSEVQVIPFLIVFCEVNLSPSFGYSILKEILNLLGHTFNRTVVNFKKFGFN